MKNLLLFLVLIFSGATTAVAQNLTTDKAESVISFKIKNLGLNVDGTFSDFTMKANIDENNIENSSFSGTATIKSIDTGIDARNNSLQEEKYFNSVEFPEMKLISSSLNKISDGKYQFTGKLTIKGKSQTVTFPISIDKTSEGVIIKGNLEIDRLDFNVGESSWVMKDNVSVSIVYKGNF